MKIFQEVLAAIFLTHPV